MLSFFFLAGSISFTSYLRYVVSSDANAPVFKNQTSFPGIPLRKRLFEIIWYIVWVFGEYPIAVMECCCQDIVGERQRSAVYHFKVHSLCSPKTETKDKVSSVYMQC